MGRQKLIDRPMRLEAQVPESILSRMNLELYSELEGKVPYGKTSELITRLLSDWLKTERGVSL